MTTATLIGLLLGIVLQRAGFCGASLLSSVVLYREWRGVLGLLVAVLVSMVGFAVLAQWDWVIPNPKPMRLASGVVGGLVFGVGMVLAGGCVTGALYKAGEGRLTSILALLGIGIGANVAGRGLLAPARKALVGVTRGISAPPGLNDALSLRYTPVALVIGGVGLVVLLAWLLRRRPGWSWPGRRRLVSAGWPAPVGGALVGVLGWAAYVSSSAAGRNYPLGGTGGVRDLFWLVVGGEGPSGAWLLFFVAGIVVGSALSARLRGQLALRSADPATLLVALVGGALVGAGAVVGRGCFIGNTVSGLALLSLHSAVFSACMVLANGVTTVLYLRGRQ